MDYTVEEHDGKFCVINTGTGEVRARHDTREDAENQIKLIKHAHREFDKQEA